MNQLPVILIFDVGKTNKKLLLFNEDYKVVHEESQHFDQIADEDGFPCENVTELTNWILSSATRVLKDEKVLLRGINFSAYGASFVYLSKDDEVFLSLYNYLKPFRESTQYLFLKNYGPANQLSQQTASPFLGGLNSGLQLYRLKIEKPAEFDKIKFALHLPQYLSYVLTGNCFSDLTSIGCHTMLWDFQKNQYHEWVKKEGIDEKLGPIINGDEIAGVYHSVPVGVGLHDSSSALVPYLNSFDESFVLISTGTWCISLNPFNDSPLTSEELNNDTLFYLSYKGKPVKASRIFAGNEHEQQLRKIELFFNKPERHFQSVKYDSTILVERNRWFPEDSIASGKNRILQSAFSHRNLNLFPDFETAYHQLIADIICQQEFSTNLIVKGTEVKNLFVDGGFSQNEIYMTILAQAFPTLKVFSARIPQASALGAAVAIHSRWNKNQIPRNLVSLKNYTLKNI